MKIIIGENEYTCIRNLHFAPEAKVVGTGVPVNEFSVEMLTADAVNIGAEVELRDDFDQLWASYQCVRVQPSGEGWMSILARCKLFYLDTITVEPCMYEGVTVGDAVEELATRSLVDIEVDEELAAVELNGYCPEQNARERLATICFACGGYIKSYNAETPQLLPADEAVEKLIPLEDTSYCPKVIHGDPVAWLHLEAWSFVEQEPQPGQQSVEVDGHTYVAFHLPTELDNQEVPFAYHNNGILLENQMLINAENVDDIATRAAQRYFPALSSELDCVNNGAYWPGDKVTFYSDWGQAITGYVEKADFRCGIMTVSHLTVVGCTSMEAARLRILYEWDDIRLGREEYSFPVGYNYSVRTRFLDKTTNGHRYIFRPDSGSVAGVMPANGVTETVGNAVALDLHKRVLRVLIVDEVAVEEREDRDGNTIRVGVIK